MLKGKRFLDYTNLFSPSKYEKNDNIILKIFSITWNYKKNYRRVKSSKISYILVKTVVLSIICDNCGSKNENTLKEKEEYEIFKILEGVIWRSNTYRTKSLYNHFKNKYRYRKHELRI